MEIRHDSVRIATDVQKEAEDTLCLSILSQGEEISEPVRKARR